MTRSKTFERACNLPVVVLGDEHMRNSGARHPNWLRFHIFDLVDAETIVYFDADTITAANYQPQRFENLKTFIAVRDIPSSFTQRDGRLLGYPVDRCLNGGWFVANRQHHSEFFRECRKAARHYHWLLFAIEPSLPVLNTHRMFFDQPIFNLLLYRMDLPIHFVDRRYNYLGYGRGDLWRMQSDIFVWHFARGLRPEYARHSEESRRAMSGKWRVDEHSFHVHSGKWRHFYDDSPRCDVCFREDGTIAGWPGLNYWFVTTTGDLVVSEWENVNFSMRFDGLQWKTADDKLLLRRVTE